MKTHLPKKNATPSTWYLIDAENQTPGKIAAEAARRLSGKHRADFTPHLDLGDGVIVINAEKVRFTGKKLDQKLYRRHSGVPGHLKEISAKSMLENNPTRVVELAVKGMLPKNKLQAPRLNRLKIYVGAEHPHTAQNPVTLTLN